MSRYKNLLPAILWLLFISAMFMMPASELPTESWFEKVYLDKWVHLLFFFILVYLFYRGLPRNNRWWIVIPSAGIIYGVLVEFGQTLFTPDRSYDVMDMIADAAGCIVAMYAWRRTAKK